MAKQDLLHEARVAARALFLGAIDDGAFVAVIRNALLKHLSQTWREAGGGLEDRDLLRIQHDSLATIDALCRDVQGAEDEAEAVGAVERLGWWHDDATLTGVRVAALKGLAANEDVLYFGPDFRITSSDVDEAIREAYEIDEDLGALLEATPWEER